MQLPPTNVHTCLRLMCLATVATRRRRSGWLSRWRPSLLERHREQKVEAGEISWAELSACMIARPAFLRHQIQNSRSRACLISHYSTVPVIKGLKQRGSEAYCTVLGRDFGPRPAVYFLLRRDTGNRTLIPNTISALGRSDVSSRRAFLSEGDPSKGGSRNRDTVTGACRMVLLTPPSSARL